MEYYTGEEIGRIFEEVLKAREAYVVSPWIQGRYAVELAKAVREGRARVVTSLDESNEFLKQLGIRGRPVSIIRLIIGALISLFGLYVTISGLVGLFIIGLPAAVPLLIGIGILILGVYIALTGLRARYRSEWGDRVRLSPKLGNDGFIHIKLYIADNEAWVGSANMTPSAVRHNVEVLVPIPVELAKEIFDYAWSRASSIAYNPTQE